MKFLQDLTVYIVTLALTGVLFQAAQAGLRHVFSDPDDTTKVESELRPKTAPRLQEKGVDPLSVTTPGVKEQGKKLPARPRLETRKEFGGVA